MTYFVNDESNMYGENPKGKKIGIMDRWIGEEIIIQTMRRKADGVAHPLLTHCQPFQGTGNERGDIMYGSLLSMHLAHVDSA